MNDTGCYIRKRKEEFTPINRVKSTKEAHFYSAVAKMVIRVMPDIPKHLEAKDKREFIYKNVILFLNKNQNYAAMVEDTLYCFTCSNLAAYHGLNNE